MPDDAITQLVHDHADLNRRVLKLGRVLAGRGSDSIGEVLRGLREDLFRHFAREEEALFPFASEHVPELADRIDAMAIAHDSICGVVARMCHVAETGGDVEALRPLFERFQTAYSAHADVEADVLAHLHGHLDADARAALAELVRGL